jgi:two-component system LytT family response regulator
MSPLRVLLVDDEPPARDRLRRLLSAHRDIEVVGEAADGRTALERIAELGPDLVFLDIQMPEADGLTVAAAIPRDGPAVVFATAFDEHALRAFELAAVDYLLKPIDKARLAETLERVRTKRTPAPDLAREMLRRLKPSVRKMAVRSGTKFVVFDVERVSAVVAQDHYAAILVDGKELLSDEPLDRLIERFDDEDFVRVHRSGIINLRFLDELKQDGDRKYIAVLSDAKRTEVPVSRDRADALKVRLGLA